VLHYDQVLAAHLSGFFDPVVRKAGIHRYVVMSLAASGNLVMEKVPEVLERAASERDLDCAGMPNPTGETLVPPTY